MQEERYDEYLKEAVAIADKMGEFVREKWGTTQTKEFESKSSVDLFTEIDVEVEKQIVAHLKEKFPDHLFLGEEDSHASGGEKPLTDTPTWVIDPIDGTTNFVHGVPLIGICIGLAIKKKAVVGVVYNPILDEKFTAVKGKGAFLNGKKLSVSTTKDINKALINSNIGYSRNDFGVKFMLKNFEALLRKGVRGVRLNGSAGLSVCDVAAGRSDSFFEWGIHSWDIAAASVIVEEAGGVCASPGKSEFDLQSRNIVCGNKDLVANLLAIFETDWTAEQWGA